MNTRLYGSSDTQTAHGTNKAKQQYWEENFEKEVESAW